MKKSMFALIAASALFTINNASAADGTVNFTGEILDQACELTSGSDNLTVNLGKVSKAALPSAGSTTAATRFSIKLLNCPAAVKNATVTFDGNPYSGDNQVLALKDETGVAKGVGIQISDDTNTIVPLFTKSKAYTLEESVENSLDFTARYIAKSTSITAGPANSTATFAITYN